MNMRWLGLCCCVLALNALSACGDDDSGGDGENEGGGAGSPTGPGAELPGELDRDTPLSELAADDVTDLCAALDEELSAAISEDDAERLSCTLLALFTSLEQGQNGQATVDRAACEEAVQQCLESDLGEPMTETMCEPGRVETAAVDCDITVGEYFDCLRGGVAQLEDALDSFTCAALSNDDAAAALSSGPGDLMTVPECMAIETECPGLLDGSSGGNEPPAESGCENTCEDANDGFCDDGGAGSDFGFCGLGTDCADCGPR